MDSGVRPLDFALFLHFDRGLDAESLSRGARSACNLYPSTACTVEGGRWLTPVAGGPRPEFAVASAGKGSRHVERFIGSPFNPAVHPPLRQLWIRGTSPGAGSLVTRIHHCVADLLGGLLWVRHQLRVAHGLDRPCLDPAPIESPRLSIAPPGADRNPGWERCAPLWTRPGKPSRERRWTTFSIPLGRLAGLSSSTDGFTFNDVLTAAALETLHGWNLAHGRAARRVGIWLPVNIRSDPLSGFGNGSSRIRVRRNYPDDLEFEQKCRAVRSQVSRARERGEWVVPQRSLLARLPLRVGGPIIRRYLNRPWADMGSAAFSHVQRWPGREDLALAGIRKLEVLGAMHRRHALMFAAVTSLDRTWMTITYDPALLRSEDIASIRDRYLQSVEAMARQA